VPLYPPNHWQKFRLVQSLALAHRYPDKTCETGKNAHSDKKAYAIARRSYISYRVALSGASFVNTVDEVGNSERFIRSDFYRKVSPDQAKEYFGLEPKRIGVSAR
jgi:hypothetical protein